MCVLALIVYRKIEASVAKPVMHILYNLCGTEITLPNSAWTVRPETLSPQMRFHSPDAYSFFNWTNHRIRKATGRMQSGTVNKHAYMGHGK